MKALKIVTVIVFAVFLCGVVSVVFGEGIFANFGLAYRQWLNIALYIITPILGSAFFIMLGFLLAMTILSERRNILRIAAGIVAFLGFFVYVTFSVFCCLGVFITSTTPEWIEEENGVKYVVVDTSSLWNITKTKYPYINSFFRSSDGIVIVDLKT